MAFTKVVLDLIYFALLYTIYFADVFQYMDSFNIGVYRVVKRDYYLDSNLKKEVSVSFRNFDSEFCQAPVPTQLGPVCYNRQHFEDAGILYYTFTAVSQFFAGYSVLGMMGLICKCSSLGVVMVEVVHYLYPALHLASLIMYVTVSRIFALSLPPGYSSSQYGASARPGIILMLVAQFVAFASMFAFIFGRSMLKKHVKNMKRKIKPVLMRRVD
jgi:hypothetical protein